MSSPLKTLNHHFLKPIQACRLCHPCWASSSSSSFRALGLSHRWYRYSGFSQSRFASTAHSRSFMEVVKAAIQQGSTARDSVAIRADQKSYSYLQLISSAFDISKLLCSEDLKTIDGLRRNGCLNGARIGVVARPSAEFVAGVLGTWLSGGVAVPLALSYPEAELLHVLNDSDVCMILSTEDHHNLMQNVAAKAAAKCSLIPPVGSSSKTSTHETFQENFQSREREGEDPALIIYTSGTTGKPKGVVHTHKSISAQVKTLAEAWEYTSTDQFLHCLPLHHIQQMPSKVAF
ncbi:hypothetical protein NL676_006777 [Syzygium grande]|nr:hypothetical protein NL676_006777 [Syzygium grande]